VNVPSHPDPYYDALLRQIREAEIAQAVGRIRAVRSSTPKTVYLLTEIPIPGLPMDVLIAYHDLVHPSRLEQAMEDLGGILPLNAKWLAGRFPERWGSENAVNCDIRRWKTTGPEILRNLKWSPVYNILSYIHTTTLNPFKLSLYRYNLPGQRRSSKCLSCFGPAETQAKLATLVGPLAAFACLSPAAESASPPADDKPPELPVVESPVVPASAPFPPGPEAKPPEPSVDEHLLSAFDTVAGTELPPANRLEDLYPCLNQRVMTPAGPATLLQCLGEDTIRIQVPGE